MSIVSPNEGGCASETNGVRKNERDYQPEKTEEEKQRENFWKELTKLNSLNRKSV